MRDKSIWHKLGRVLQNGTGTRLTPADIQVIVRDTEEAGQEITELRKKYGKAWRQAEEVTQLSLLIKRTLERMQDMQDRQLTAQEATIETLSLAVRALAGKTDI